MPRRDDGYEGQEVRVLIVDDAIDDAHTMGAWLRGAPGIAAVEVAGGARAGLKVAQKLRPDVVVMAVEMREMNGLQATQILNAEMPTRVILMSYENSRAAVEQSMWAGARAHLVKPPQAEELLHTVRGVARLPIIGRQPPSGDGGHRPPPSGQRGQHIIAVCGPKGGVGRSIIATNLAVCLAEMGGAVALVDANLESGNDHLLLNVMTANSLATLLDKDEVDWQSIDQTAFRHESGLRLLRAPCRLSEADRFQANDMRAILVEVREHFDYVVVDADSRFSISTIAALRAAERVLLITTLEITAIDRVSEFLGIVHEEQITTQPCMLVGNRYDGG
ncbi:MAG TPA: response regulator, partial [Ktedonobacterales bacterium]|nr:response regulator [Ktedonobacterales bacterium]